MKLKKWIPALLAVVLGGIAAKIARDSVMRSRHVEIVTPKLVQVAVADSNMMAGHDLKLTDVSTITLTSPTPPPDTFTNPVDLVGRVLLSPILKGQTIQGANLAPKGVPPTLSVLIPPGMRAVTMNVDDVNSQTGMLTAGSHVDIVSTMPNGKDTSSHVLIKDVLVQAVGQLVMPHTEDGKPMPGYHTISLIVTPHDGELIHLATMMARLHLMLRGANRGDSVESDPGYVTVADIIGDGDRIVQEAKERGGPATTQPSSDNKVALKTTPKWTVEVIKGGGASTRLEFDLPKQPEMQADTASDRGRAIPGNDENPQE